MGQLERANSFGGDLELILKHGSRTLEYTSEFGVFTRSKSLLKNRTVVALERQASQRRPDVDLFFELKDEAFRGFP